MTVGRRKSRNNRWIFNFELSGQRYQGYCIDPDTREEATTKRQALAVEEKIRVRARQLEGQPARSLQSAFSLAQAVMLHIESQAGSTKLHVANLKNYAREILSFFGAEIAVTAITAVRVSAYRAFCAKQTIKVWRGGADKRRSRSDPRWWKDIGRVRTPASANHYLDCLRAALNIAHRIRDPLTGNSVLPFVPDVEAFHVPARKPTPMPDEELDARSAVARPWTRDAIELARLFGLRHGETTKVTVRHIRTEIIKNDAGSVGKPYHFLFLTGEELKGGSDERIHGGWAGSALLERLRDQARQRGVKHLISWPGIVGLKLVDRGDEPPKGAWRPLKSIRRSWKNSGKTAGIDRPHRFHDVRARFITELAKHAPARLVQGAARHKDFDTTQMYIDAAEMDVAQAVENATRTRRAQ